LSYSVIPLLKEVDLLMRINKIIKLFVSVIKKSIKSTFNFFTLNKNIRGYLKKAKNSLENKNRKEALKILQEGTVEYPKIYQLRAKIVDIAMDEKEWELASLHWEAIYKIKKGKLKASAYSRYGKSLRLKKSYSCSSNILYEGLGRFPNNSLIISELIKTLIKQKQWLKAAGLSDKLFNMKHDKLPIKSYLDASIIYKKAGSIEKAEKIISKGLEINPRNKKLINEYANFAIKNKNWTKAIKRFEDNYIQNNLEMSFNIMIKLSMLYQMVGDGQKAKKHLQLALEKHPKKAKKDSKGYRKLVIFDNGESRIEFYKKLRKTNKVIVTFDSINMVWGNPPFAYRLLSRENLDIIAIRKRKRQTYQQDLSQEDFKRAVSFLVKDYKDKIAYGYSLGAYTALYFASIINCRILAISPRLSIHPIYGRENIIPKYDFKHNISFKYNPKISPIIVYDPKNIIDNTYVQEEVLQSFPNAKLVKVPYGGHGMAPHLSRMGLLKEFVLTVIDGKVPKYKREYKSKSSIYFRLLGSACLRHNKLKWAMDLANRSIKMRPTDKLGIKLKADVLIRLKKYDEAIKFLDESIELCPNILDIRVHLIDLYILIKDEVNAKNEIDKAIKKFGKKDILYDKLQLVNKH